MKKIEDFDMAPSPGRLVESLRDTGYSFVTSVADIVDNSIAANATVVNVDLILEFDGNLKLYIADNGNGMNELDLLNAMKYGSSKRENPKSLGKFGMGLKTASTAFCRSLTVASRQNGVLNARQWDIDEVIKSNKWKLLTPAIDEDDLEYLNKISEKNGTLIIWDRIDRVVRSTDGSPDRNQVEKFQKSLILHLSGVFGRFISSSESPVEININGQSLEAWDPFCLWLGDLKAEDKQMTIEHDGKEIGKFDFKVYILPNKSDMTKDQEKRARYGLDNQGFHVYREDRLIYSGGWLNRMFVKEPHFNLMRVEISFTHELDEYFQIDIKKSTISLPHVIRDEIKKRLVALRREAERRYRGATRRGAGANGTDIHDASNNAIDKKLDDNVSSELKDLDPVGNTATLRNQFGETKIKIPIHEGTDVVVQAEKSLDHGVLWGYFINKSQKHGVLLNESHEFYRRFYLSSKVSFSMIQAMDSVFWALAEAELTTINDKAKKNLEELRFKVSRILDDLAGELPELTEEENLVDNE
jgi:hypothetical protein